MYDNILRALRVGDPYDNEEVLEGEDMSAKGKAKRQAMEVGALGQHGLAGMSGIGSDLFRGALTGFMNRRKSPMNSPMGGGWGIAQILERLGRPLGGRTAGSLGGPGSLY